MDLNADLGESFGVWRLGDDEAMLEVVTSANVACGFHAGDAATLARTCRAAAARGVRIGAQVSYRDLAGFGRRFIDATAEDLTADVIYQIGALQALAHAAGSTVGYVKPHGALYGMAARDEKIAAAIADAVLPFGVPILGMAFTAHETAYRDKGVELVPEFYADLAYDGDGNLILSRVHDAVDPAKAAARVLRVMKDYAVTTTTGKDIPVKATTVCVHSDTPSAVAIAAELDWVLRR